MAGASTESPKFGCAITCRACGHAVEHPLGTSTFMFTKSVLYDGHRWCLSCHSEDIEVVDYDPVPEVS